MMHAITKISSNELKHEAVEAVEGAGVGVALGLLSRTLGGLDVGGIPIDGALSVAAAIGAHVENSEALAEISGDCAAVLLFRKMSKK